VLAALRHRRLRLYSAGLLFWLTGNWVEAAAFGHIVLLLRGSAATLGLIGFVNTIPNLLLGLPAGALADRYDRRRPDPECGVARPVRGDRRVSGRFAERAEVVDLAGPPGARTGGCVGVRGPFAVRRTATTRVDFARPVAEMGGSAEMSGGGHVVRP
jgi:hypothetical protein